MDEDSNVYPIDYLTLVSKMGQRVDCSIVDLEKKLDAIVKSKYTVTHSIKTRNKTIHLGSFCVVFENEEDYNLVRLLWP